MIKIPADPRAKRPVAFRVHRAIDDRLSTTEWRYFTDEAQAYAEAEALGTDYQGLYVRDGSAHACMIQIPADLLDSILTELLYARMFTTSFRRMPAEDEARYDAVLKAVIDALTNAGAEK